MAQTTFVQEGRQIEFTPTVAVAAGQVVVNGDLVGIALGPVAANVQEPWLWMVYSTSPSNQERALQLRLGLHFTGYAANQRATATAAGNKLIGKCTRAAADAATTVRIRPLAVVQQPNLPLAHQSSFHRSAPCDLGCSVSLPYSRKPSFRQVICKDGKCSLLMEWSSHRFKRKFSLIRVRCSSNYRIGCDRLNRIIRATVRVTVSGGLWKRDRRWSRRRW